MFSPTAAFLSVIVSFLVSLGLFSSRFVSVEDLFFLSFLFLIAIYTVIAIASDTESYEKRKWFQDPGKIIGQYTFWGIILLGVYALFSRHPFYRDAFPGADRSIEWFLRQYIFWGIPYFVLTDKFRVSTKTNIGDPYLITLAFLRRLRSWKNRRNNKKYFGHRMKTFLIGGALRTHFYALMISQSYPFWQQICDELHSGHIDWSFTKIGALLLPAAWIIDGNNACIGYFWESKFTRTRFRKMDPNPMSWLITLSCYLPFSYWATWFIPVNQSGSMINFSVSGSDGAAIFLDTVTLILLFGYVASGTQLCFSTSNLSFKAVQTRGFYSIIRHPATFFKLSFFSINFFRFEPYISGYAFLAYLAVICIYIARIFCEERFLSHFVDYQNYKLRTRYRLIPGVF